MVSTVGAFFAGAGTYLTGGTLASAGAAGNAFVVAGYYGAQIAVAIGTGYAAQALQGTPELEASKANLKQTMPPRIDAYGRRRLGGAYLLWEAKGKTAYDVIAVKDGPMEAVEEVWLKDQKLTFVGGGTQGFVANRAEYGGGTDNNLIKVEWRNGTASPAPYADHVSALGAEGIWTNNHLARGITTIGARYSYGKRDSLAADYPIGFDLQFSLVGRMRPVWDPRDPLQSRTNPATWKAGCDAEGRGNIGLYILDFCLRAEGMAMDYETEIAPAIEHWKGEIDICKEAVPLKTGGTEPRYWGSVHFAYADDPQETLDKLRAACDGKMLRDADGVWRLWVGKVRAPTIHLTDDDIADYDVQLDAAGFDVVNVVQPTFESEAHGWTMVEAPASRDEADILARGREFSSPLPLAAVNSASQSQRLAKRARLRLTTELRGSLTGRLSAARALGHRWIRLTLADLDLDGAVVEQETGGRIAFSRGAAHIPFALVPPGMDAWDAATEEGSSGVAPDRAEPSSLLPPTIASLTTFAADAGSGAGVRLRVIPEGPADPDLTWHLGWRVKGAAAWVEGQLADGDPTPGVLLETGLVPVDQIIQVRVAYENGAGRRSAWGPEPPAEVSTATPDYYTPGPNLLASPEAFDAAAWVVNADTGSVAPVVTADHHAAPNGALTADRIVFDRGSGGFSRIQQTAAVTSGVTQRLAVWLRADTPGASIALRLDSTNGATLNLTTTWTRYTLDATATGATMVVQLLLYTAISGAPVTATVHAWGAQLSPL